jgi:hypothetical protein
LNKKQPLKSNPANAVLTKGNNMKTPIIVLTALAVAGASLKPATAGDREWATAGKILTGVVAASVLAKAINPPEYTVTTYYPSATVITPAPVCVQPTVVTVVPAPVVVAAQPPATLFVQPAPVIVRTTPVYVAPTTACVQPVTVVMAPPPTVRYSFGFVHRHSPHWRSHTMVRW